LAAHWLPVLLLSDAVALVAIVALFGLTLVFIVVAGIFLQANRAAAPPSSAQPPIPVPAHVKVTRGPRAGTRHLHPIEIDVPTKHVDDVIGALQAAGWMVQETGEVVATDDDEEALTTLSVQVPVQPSSPRALGTGEEIR